jgi:hypothetical protein
MTPSDKLRAGIKQGMMKDKVKSEGIGQKAANRMVRILQAIQTLARLTSGGQVSRLRTSDFYAWSCVLYRADFCRPAP